MVLQAMAVRPRAIFANDSQTKGGEQIVLQKGLAAATITGCLLRGKDAVVDESGADVQVGLNTMH